MMSSQRESVKILILESGEHIIGFCTNGENGHEIVVERPVSLIPKPDGSGIMFVPYLQFTEVDTVPFKQSTLRHDPIEPKADLADHYYKQFGVGLELPAGGGGNIIQV